MNLLLTFQKPITVDTVNLPQASYLTRLLTHMSVCRTLNALSVAIGLTLLLTGALWLDYPDWDIDISLLAARGLSFVWSVRRIRQTGFLWLPSQSGWLLLALQPQK